MKSFLLIIFVVIVSFFYMQQKCVGLYEKQISKIPSIFISKQTNPEDPYEKCVYKGFKYFFSRKNIDKVIENNVSKSVIKYENESNEYFKAIVDSEKIEVVRFINTTFNSGDTYYSLGEYTDDYNNIDKVEFSFSTGGRYVISIFRKGLLYGKLVGYQCPDDVKSICASSDSYDWEGIEIPFKFTKVDRLPRLENRKSPISKVFVENNLSSFSISIPDQVDNLEKKTVTKVGITANDNDGHILIGPDSYNNFLKIYLGNAKDEKEIEKFVHEKIPLTKNCTFDRYQEILDSETVSVLFIDKNNKTDGIAGNCNIGNPLYIKYSKASQNVAVWQHNGQDVLFVKDKNEFDDIVYSSFKFTDNK